MCIRDSSTHQKANANKRKRIKKEVEILKKKYEDDLLEEINRDRECIGKETYDSMNRDVYKRQFQHRPHINAGRRQ